MFRTGIHFFVLLNKEKDIGKNVCNQTDFDSSEITMGVSCASEIFSFLHSSKYFVLLDNRTKILKHLWNNLRVNK